MTIKENARTNLCSSHESVERNMFIRDIDFQFQVVPFVRLSSPQYSSLSVEEVVKVHLGCYLGNALACKYILSPRPGFDFLLLSVMAAKP